MKLTILVHGIVEPEKYEVEANKIRLHPNVELAICKLGYDWVITHIHSGIAITRASSRSKVINKTKEIISRYKDFEKAVNYRIKHKLFI